MLHRLHDYDHILHISDMLDYLYLELVVVQYHLVELELLLFFFFENQEPFELPVAYLLPFPSQGDNSRVKVTNVSGMGDMLRCHHLKQIHCKAIRDRCGIGNLLPKSQHCLSGISYFRELLVGNSRCSLSLGGGGQRWVQKTNYQVLYGACVECRVQQAIQEKRVWQWKVLVVCQWR